MIIWVMYAGSCKLADDCCGTPKAAATSASLLSVSFISLSAISFVRMRVDVSSPYCAWFRRFESSINFPIYTEFIKHYFNFLYTKTIWCKNILMISSEKTTLFQNYNSACTCYWRYSECSCKSSQQSVRNYSVTRKITTAATPTAVPKIEQWSVIWFLMLQWVYWSYISYKVLQKPIFEKWSYYLQSRIFLPNFFSHFSYIFTFLVVFSLKIKSKAWLTERKTRFPFGKGLVRRLLKFFRIYQIPKIWERNFGKIGNKFYQNLGGIF